LDGSLESSITNKSPSAAIGHPAGLDRKGISGRLPIRINPGMAFGTGTHPTTQLCLEFLEELVRPEMTIFDIGCGSGILSAGAVILGAARVIAVDIDPASVRSTTENCERTVSEVTSCAVRKN
jgi:ribosomal protein L11 methyltransferase